MGTLHHPEPVELQKLLKALDKALDRQRYKFENGNWSYEYFKIIIGDDTMKFLVGGPQIQALDAFVENIANENGYAINWEESTVTDE